MECPHCHSQVNPHAKHCKRCGGAIPLGQHLLEEAGLIEPVRAAKATPAASAPARNAGRVRFARLGDRFLAFALDTALLFGLFAIVDAWAFMRLGIFEGAELQLTVASLVAAVTVNAVILFLYGWLLEAAFGATLGKALVGIRIVATAELSPLSASAIRNVFRIVDGLGLYLVGTAVAGCTDARQRIGDLFAKTAVVEEKFGIGVRLAAIVLWIATMAGAGWAVPRICSASHPVHSPYLSQVVVRVGKNGDSVYVRVGGFTMDAHPTSVR
jgi:uncharacterized RDD family membrane protein YckC